MRLMDICHVNSNDDRFVGLIFKDNEIRINFPLGYRLSKNEDFLSEDILALLRIFRMFSNKEYGEFTKRSNNNQIEETFPFFAYQEMILYYLNYGLYFKKERNYKEDKRGKINWSKTIKREKFYLVQNKLMYLNFITKKSNYNQENIITYIHEYCVYESIRKLGWLYNIKNNINPKIKYNKELFLRFINEKYRTTYDDKTKELLNNMKLIILAQDCRSQNANSFYGTYRFEYIWERMVDFSFGINNKEKYFPKTVWNIRNEKEKINAPLEPDTIMEIENKTYILDAKYYKYGITYNKKDLPGSSSISKQIIYGEYVSKFKKDKNTIYNAFIMPFNKNDNEEIISVGNAISGWKNQEYNYEYIVGILIDTTDFIRNISRLDNIKMNKIADCILSELKDNV